MKLSKKHGLAIDYSNKLDLSTISGETSDCDDKIFKLPISKVNDQIYLSSIENICNYTQLEKNNISYVLNVSDKIFSKTPGNKTVFLDQPISSKSFCFLMKIIPLCIEFIDSAINSNRNVLICCHDGYSRTVVILIAYYILKYSINFQESIDLWNF